MTKYINTNSLYIDETLFKFISNDVLPKVNFKKKIFWSEFQKFIETLEPQRISLIKKRNLLQSKIDSWHQENKNKLFDEEKYKKFLEKIGYLLPEGNDFKIETKNIDPEISSIAGPQLVVPVMNARYAINAANARWGSLYDAIYGTNLIPNKKPYDINDRYNPLRGAIVVKKSYEILDKFSPLINESFSNIKNIKINNSKLVFESFNKNITTLLISKQFVGYLGKKNNPKEILLKKNGLHIRILIDKKNTSNDLDHSIIKDVMIESAISVIMDLEDSVAAVDGEDKKIAYSNWFGLINGSLKEKIIKDHKTFTRSLSKDFNYFNPKGKEETLKSKALMLVRNVGHLMTNPAVLDKEKKEVGEGLLDAMFTTLCSINDLKEKNNSRYGSIYIVKPKMHGPEEVKFAVSTFELVEKILKLPKNTIKIGIMDEERRTSLNLKECIRAAKTRTFFINTGFLDRTGDEIHTSMHAGPMVKKTEMKNKNWIAAYENWNVDVGLKCGFSRKAQIGKGMWAMPDLMAEMHKEKIQHCLSGASTAWVPSPTAATVHALHYHEVNVFDRQKTLSSRPKSSINDLLDIPVVKKPNWTLNEIQKEIDNNTQSILGYVVRWVEHGIGCSKVPDINNIGLMEDRATLRISSQHISNWLHHRICSKRQVLNSMKKMAKIVDKQNSRDRSYIPMSTDFDKSFAFNAACSLVFNGKNQPSGYTEPILHKIRLAFKAQKAKIL